MKNGKYQIKDIPDWWILGIIKTIKPKNGPYEWVSFWDIEAYFPAIPRKVLRAKCANMVRRKVIAGCDGMHECRGDYYIL